MSAYKFQQGRSYRILSTPGKGNALVGRLLTITALGAESAHLPHSSVICKGTIRGMAGEFDFPGGVRLQEPFETCYCSKWAFPHKRGANCGEEE